MTARMAHGEAAALMDRAQIESAVDRIASEILARDSQPGRLALVGIRSRGVPLARRIAARIASRTGESVPVGALDITLYRDDLTGVRSQPIVRGTDLAFPIAGKRIVLVDDVLFTGRTIRAALDEIIDFGRPERIELAVLVDRGGRELPIQPDYVGVTTTVPPGSTVQVLLQEEDGREEVVFLGEAESA